MQQGAFYDTATTVSLLVLVLTVVAVVIASSTRAPSELISGSLSSGTITTLFPYLPLGDAVPGHHFGHHGACTSHSSDPVCAAAPFSCTGPTRTSSPENNVTAMSSAKAMSKQINCPIFFMGFMGEKNMKKPAPNVARRHRSIPR